MRTQAYALKHLLTSKDYKDNSDLIKSILKTRESDETTITAVNHFLFLIAKKYMLSLRCHQNKGSLVRSEEEGGCLARQTGMEEKQQQRETKGGSKSRLQNEGKEEGIPRKQFKAPLTSFLPWTFGQTPGQSDLTFLF